MNIKYCIYAIYITTMVLCSRVDAQDTLSSGFGIFKKEGIYFGRPITFNGLRLNLLDLHTSEQINGINVSVVDSRVKAMNGISLTIVSHDSGNNGISIGAIMAEASNVNGIQFGGLTSYITKQMNGIDLCAFVSYARKMNGIGMSLVFVGGDTLNGLFVGLLGVYRPGDHPEIQAINGIALSLLGTSAIVVNGITIGGYNGSDIHKGLSIGICNKSNNLHGIQIGIVNYAGNNPPGFKLLPFINMHFGNKNYH